MSSLDAGLDVEAIRTRRLEDDRLVELEELLVCLVVAEFEDGDGLFYSRGVWGGVVGRGVPRC